MSSAARSTAGPTASSCGRRALPGRSKIFRNSADEYLKVHDRGPTEADVTEGSHNIWERLYYDWSDPDHIVLSTTDSNLLGGHSGHTYTLERQPDGRTDLDVVIVREGKNLKGRVLAFFTGNLGKRSLEKQFDKTVKAIEARHDGARRRNPRKAMRQSLPLGGRINDPVDVEATAAAGAAVCKSGFVLLDLRQSSAKPV